MQYQLPLKYNLRKVGAAPQAAITFLNENKFTLEEVMTVPSSSIKICGPIAQFGRAPAPQAGGRGFNSPSVH